MVHFLDKLRKNKSEDENATLENCTSTTKIGKAVEFVLGLTDEVKKFDKARQRHKEYLDNQTLNAYQDILGIIQTRISKKNTELKEQLKEWEMQYFSQKNRLPTSKDVTSDNKANLLMNKMAYSKALMKSWRGQK